MAGCIVCFTPEGTQWMETYGAGIVILLIMAVLGVYFLLRWVHRRERW